MIILLCTYTHLEETVAGHDDEAIAAGDDEWTFCACTHHLPPALSRLSSDSRTIRRGGVRIHDNIIIPTRAPSTADPPAQHVLLFLARALIPDPTTATATATTKTTTMETEIAIAAASYITKTTTIIIYGDSLLNFPTTYARERADNIREAEKDVLYYLYIFDRND